MNCGPSISDHDHNLKEMVSVVNYDLFQIDLQFVGFMVDIYMYTNFTYIYIYTVNHVGLWCFELWLVRRV